MTRLFVAGRERDESGKPWNRVYEVDSTTRKHREIIKDHPHSFSALGLLSLKYHDVQSESYSLRKPTGTKLVGGEQERPRLKEDLEYLLAGDKNSIIIKNLNFQSSETKNIFIPKLNHAKTGFNYVDVLGGKAEPDLKQIIVASHDEYGVIMVPLEDFLNREENYLRIDAENRRNVLFRQRGQGTVRARVIQNKLYVAVGNALFEAGEQPAWPSASSLEITAGEEITGLDYVRSQEAMVLGTNQGRVYVDRKEITKVSGKIMNVNVLDKEHIAIKSVGYNGIITNSTLDSSTGTIVPGEEPQQSLVTAALLNLPHLDNVQWLIPNRGGEL